MGNKLAGFKWKGKQVWESAKGSLFVITKMGRKSYLPKVFKEGYQLGKKRKRK